MSHVDKSAFERIAGNLAAPQAETLAVADFVLVPREPTLEMGWAYLEAARKASPHIDHAFNHPGYCAMLAAAPTPTASIAPTMDDAIAAGDGTLHGAIDYWQRRALAAEAGRDVDETSKVLADNYLNLTAAPKAEGEADLEVLYDPGKDCSHARAYEWKASTDLTNHHCPSCGKRWNSRAAPVAQAAAGASETVRAAAQAVVDRWYNGRFLNEGDECQIVEELMDKLRAALARPEADADRASGVGQ